MRESKNEQSVASFFCSAPPECFFRSVTQSSTVHIGWDGQQQIHVPFKEIIPILSPNDLIIDGWDINNQNLYQAMARAKVSRWGAFRLIRIQPSSVILIESLWKNVD